jgi:hypothetical protein
MLRKILAAGAVALAGLVVFGGVASADVDYGADTQVALSSSQGSVNSGDDFDVFGDGYLPGETVGVTATYTDVGNGLRSSRALETLSSPSSFTAVADANGHFSQSVNYDQVGTITFVATGMTSGRSASTVVKVGAVGSVSTTTVAAAADWSSSDGATGSLASTGASVAGPIAIGLGALLAGLALLFFGTRGVIRHKGARTTTSV